MYDRRKTETKIPNDENSAFPCQHMLGSFRSMDGILGTESIVITVTEQNKVFSQNKILYMYLFIRI